jgi:predicted nucleic acid-binding protein
MTSTLIDSNVLIDVLEQRLEWIGWVTSKLEQLSQTGTLVINQIAYGEASIPYDQEDVFATTVDTGWVVREDLPWSATFRAGKAFRQYRERGGVRDMILPDFFIGAHASVKGYKVLTRDGPRFRTYFPEIEVIAPDTHP